MHFCGSVMGGHLGGMHFERNMHFERICTLRETCPLRNMFFSSMFATLEVRLLTFLRLKSNLAVTDFYNSNCYQPYPGS